LDTVDFSLPPRPEIDMTLDLLERLYDGIILRIRQTPKASRKQSKKTALINGFSVKFSTATDVMIVSEIGPWWEIPEKEKNLSLACRACRWFVAM
jgi:hypothetical protein